MLGRISDPGGRARLRGATSLGAGIVLCACAALIAVPGWPASRWSGSWNDIVLLHRLVVPTLANATVLVSGYLALASLAWGIADASMHQPLDLAAFDTPPPGAAAGASRICRTFTWSANDMASASRAAAPVRVAMSVLDRVLARSRPSTLTLSTTILITGDMTDAGRARNGPNSSPQCRAPRLAARTLMLPGNHDVNIVDRANPARLDLPTSPNRRLRQMRTLSAIDAVQGERVQVVDPSRKFGRHAGAGAGATPRSISRAFADTGRCGVARRSPALGERFRWCCRPTRKTGLASSC